jgi:hypothetical protein
LLREYSIELKTVIFPLVAYSSWGFGGGIAYLIPVPQILSIRAFENSKLPY